jgi:chromosome segregation ATPase
MTNHSTQVLNHRLQQQASEYDEVLDAKDSQIGDLTGLVDSYTGLVDSESDQTKLKRYAYHLKTRLEDLQRRVLAARQHRADLEAELAAAESARKDVRAIRKKLEDAAEDLQKDEAELVNLENLLAASEDILSKHEAAMNDKRRIVELEAHVADSEASTRNAWMIITALFLTLSAGAGAQLYMTREKWSKFVDDPDTNSAAPHEVGMRA